jgi:hypothetical protein
MMNRRIHKPNNFLLTLASVIAMLGHLNVNSQILVKVLFIGSSWTYIVDLPTWLLLGDFGYVAGIRVGIC